MKAGCLLLASCLFCGPTLSAVTPGAPILEHRLEGFEGAHYETAVAAILRAFEEQRGEKLSPGATGRVGLKVYTNSGPGLATPVSLVRAVLASLKERGFQREDLFLVDMNETRLRRSGFLSGGFEESLTFEGHPVYALESGRYYDPEWYYDSPLPPRSEPGLVSHRREFSYEPMHQDRQSQLAVPLLRNVDFWINLPVYSDHPALGLNGALVNATLWNGSNTLRFFQSDVNGPAAVAEMAAVPELAERWIFTLASRELYQFVGGPAFRSLYTASEPVLMLSADPVALDAEMYRLINKRRADRRFPPLEEELRQLEYARQLNLGRPGAEVEQVGRTGP
jgi:hypothetical protein